MFRTSGRETAEGGLPAGSGVAGIPSRTNARRDARDRG
jgi:hypothetical protein